MLDKLNWKSQLKIGVWMDYNFEESFSGLEELSVNPVSYRAKTTKYKIEIL